MLNVGKLMIQLEAQNNASTALTQVDGDLKRVGASATTTAATVKKTSSDQAAAYNRMQAASAKLVIAEQRLAEMKRQGAASTQQMMAAEARVSSARASAISTSSRYNSVTRQVAASHQQATAAATQQTAAVNTLSATLARARGLMAMAGLGSGIMIAGKVFLDTIQNARALGAQTNQLNVLFEGGASKIEAWGQKAAKAMRMSQREAQAAAIDFATYGQAAGLAGDKLIDFSTSTAELAADMASFFAVKPEDAIDAMTSALAGQSRPMRQYGVLLDQNTLRETAYREGITDTNRELSQQEKVQATYVAMFEQLSYVQGDVTRTSGAFGNQLKLLKARWEENTAAIGKSLMPIVKAFVSLLAGPGMVAMGAVGDVLGLIAGAFSSLPGPIQAVIKAMVGLMIVNKLMGSTLTNVGSRVKGAFSGIGASISNVQRAAALSGTSISRFGASVVALGRHIPLVDKMRTSFINASSGANRFPAAAGAASAAMTGMKGAAGGLMGALGGPWGLAITGAVLALSMWQSAKQKDAAESERTKAATQEWADALLESRGAIDGTIKSMASKKIADTEAYETAEKLGISQQDLTDAVLGGREAYDAWLHSMQAANPQAAAGDWAGLTGDIQKIATEYDNGRAKAIQMAKANGTARVSFDGTNTAVGAMSDAMQDFDESTDGAASKVDKLAKALDDLQDDQLTEEEALQAWSDNMRDLTEAFGDGAAAMVKMDGHIDVTTEKGSKLQDSIIDQRKAYNETAAAALESARTQGLSAGDTLDAVKSKLEPLRQQFIDTAVANRVPLAVAEKMADTYLGLPEDVITNLELMGTDAAIDKLTSLRVEGARPIQMQYVMYDNTPEVRKRLDEIKVKYSIIDGKVVINKEDVEQAQQALGDLGLETTSLPDGFVKITDTTPENMARLRDLEVKTQTLPDGTVVINTADKEFWEFVERAQQPIDKTVRLHTIVEQQEYVNRIVQYARDHPDGSYANGGIRQYVDGGIAAVESYANGNLPNNAVIQAADPSGGLVQWAEPETDGEAFIPLAWSKRGRSTAILKEVARRFGLGLVPDAAADLLSKAMSFRALPRQIRAFADGAMITAGGLKNYMRGIDGAPYDLGGWGQGWTTDCSGGQSIAMNAIRGNMQPGTGERAGTAAFDSYTAAQGLTPGRAPAGIAAYEVGWSPEHTSGTIFDPAGGDVNVEMGGANGGGKYGSSVGSRDGQFPQSAWIALQGDDGSGTTGSGIQDIELTKDSSREDVARKIIAEGRKRGYSDDEIKGVLATAIQESNLEWVEGGGGAWHGYFQQDESYEGRDDPNTNVTGFYDRLDEKKNSEGASDDIMENIFWLQQRPGDTSAADAVSNGRSGYLDEIKSKDDDAAKMLAELGPSVGTDNATSPGTSGVGSQVYVTGGHLDSIGSGTTTTPSDSDTTKKSTPATPSTTGDGRPKIVFHGPDGKKLGENDAAKFADGGTVPGVGNEDSELIMAMPGEEVIRKRVASAPGVRQFLKRVNAGMIPPHELRKFGHFEDGGTVGFGGDADDDSDYMKPQNWRDYGRLLVGGVNAAASVVAPYVAMAQSGNIDASALLPTMDTSTADNDFGVAQVVGEYADDIKEQLGEIARLLAKGERVTVTIEGLPNQDPSAAKMIQQAMGV